MVRDLRVPIGGMRSSGLGREGGREALRFFAEPVVVVQSKGK
jgi:aminomuconate-semialdehyde/2-hydroxymuconate-6-semialdehyde dehydrogenase